ncbi:MAG: UPF0182 family protein [Actinomycetia bacterium]|nr:UPF0182 family protein [Actinomycetes bacterium]
MPSLSLSRRTKVILLVVVALIVLLAIASALVGVYVDWLWFGAVGYRNVFKGILATRVIVFVIFAVLAALIVGGNVAAAYLMRPPFRPLSGEQQNLERYRLMVEPRKKLVLSGLMVLVALIGGLSAQGGWRVWMLWRFGGSFGVTDPQFHKDISFYAWDYPAYRAMLSFGFGTIFFAILLSAAVHYLVGAIRVQTPGPKITLSARRHLTILVFVFIALKAVAYWLDRYGLVFSSRGRVTGASYADVNAALPAKTILFWIAIVIAATVLASIWLKSAQLPVISFVVLLILSIVIGGVYPAAIQQFSVKPNASAKEAKYISRNIQATRQAYGIVSGTDVDYETYNVANSPSITALDPASPTISDIRILDPNQISATFTQQQQIRNVYGFSNKLDVDRYTIGGQTKDYIVGARELDASNLSGDQSNWINQHTVYTHGFGFVAAPADVDVTNNKDLYAEKNIPPTGIFNDMLTNPAIYYGELLPDYSIVGAKGVPQEYNGSDATKITYDGGGGVSLGSFFTRLALAVQYKQLNFLLNSAVSADGAKIIFDRDPRQMVQKVAPFLTVDGDPYPFVDADTGHVMWMVDGYTTMSNYPYSEQESLSALTSDTLTETQQTASQPNDTINYIRNSVKATVDAYTGQVTLYQWNQDQQPDPVLAAWMKIFPGTVQPQSTMPQAVLDHVRYPQDLFEIQRALIGSYHVDNPVTFYNVGDRWTVPKDPSPANQGANQPPYYVLAAPPTGGLTPQFQLTSPMIVNQRNNLAAFITVSCDPATYGQMTVLTIPQSKVTNGPEQIANIFNTNSVITKDLSLFNAPGGGSTVIYGNLLTLPIGDSLLYVEPLYVRAAAEAGSFPTLQRVLAVYGDKIGYGPDLANALENLGQSTVGLNIPNPGTGSTTPATTAPSSSAPPTSAPPSSAPPPASSAPPASGGDVDTILNEMDQAFADLQAAYATGDPVAVGQAEARIKQLTEQYLQARGQLPSATPTG